MSGSQSLVKGVNLANTAGTTSKSSSRPLNGFASSRPAILSLAKLVLFGVANLPPIRAAPLRFLPATLLEADGGMPVDNATLWVYLGVAVALVLLGGAFAGLTIALMGQVQSNLALLT